jgi:pyruvate dehydrogenase E2 component (dihydrolipoamide acetyltransferase)
VGQPVSPVAKTRVEPMSNMRQKIAEHMVMSKRVSAHVTTVHRVDMTKRREDAREAQGRFRGAPWHVAHVPAVRDARGGRRCAQFPIVNASIDGTNIIYHNEINIGIAVALDGGLIVPVIRNADEKNVTGTAAVDCGPGGARAGEAAEAR